LRAAAAFFAHGSPMSALGGDEHAAALRSFGASHRPKAIVVVSAHWQTPAPARITSWKSAPLVYDFGGFPEELYRLVYPAPGDPGLAGRIAALLPGAAIETRRGLDHGAWVPLRLSWPEADIPVVQVSLPEAPPDKLFELGEALRPLRDEGVLIAASGGIVHNLRRVQLSNKDAPVDGWAAEFDSWVEERMRTRDREALFRYRALAPHADAAVPTTEHFDPLFVALGASHAADSANTVYTGFLYGNLSMRTIVFESEPRP
jgi:4,5-DOPA dioxygenase extradiol